MDNLKKLREEYNLSQERLGELVNLSQQSIYKYENNMAEPDFHTLREFSTYFDTSIDYLLDLTDDPKPYTQLKENDLTDFESKFIRRFRKLTKEQQLLSWKIINEFK